MQRWPTDRIRHLKQLFRDGKGDAAIARELGVSRPAVIGKRQRLGLKRADRMDAMEAALMRKRREEATAPTTASPVASKAPGDVGERC